MTSRLAVLGVSAVLALLGAAPAAAEPCWQRVIRDWSDGRIDNVYAPTCYRGAIAHLPPNAGRVSTAPADLQRGLAYSLASPPQASTANDTSTTPVLIVIAAGGAFLLLSMARMLRARRSS